MAIDYRAEFERLQEKLPTARSRLGGFAEAQRYADLPETLQIYEHGGYKEPKPLYEAQWQIDRAREFAERFVETGLWTEESPYYKYFTSRKIGQMQPVISELQLRPGEKYYDWVQRLAKAGYRPFSGAAGPGAVPSEILRARQRVGERDYYGPTPTPVTTPTTSQPSPQQVAPVSQPTQTPSISLTPAVAQPTYQPAPAQTYQSTYYQANGYKPYSYQGDTFGDKPFSYAYQRPRLQQSYTGI